MDCLLDPKIWSTREWHPALLRKILGCQVAYSLCVLNQVEDIAQKLLIVYKQQPLGRLQSEFQEDVKKFSVTQFIDNSHKYVLVGVGLTTKFVEGLREMMEAIDGNSERWSKVKERFATLVVRSLQDLDRIPDITMTE